MVVDILTMSVLFYRRPEFILRDPGHLSQTACQRYAEKATRNKSKIPQELSFDNIVNDKVLPPCAKRDFLDYMVYVSHDAENLQFYLWLEGYKKRFAALNHHARALSPEWTDLSAAKGDDKAPTATVSEVEKSTGDIRLAELGSSPFKSEFDSPASSITALPRNQRDSDTLGSKPSVEFGDGKSYRGYEQVQLSEKGSLIPLAAARQPFRDEISKVIANYIEPGAPRELNLSHKDRTNLMYALERTTHPSAFNSINTMVEGSLRNHSHPNFVRWSICNANQPRVFFVRSMGVSHIIFGLIIYLLLTLSRASRWWRIIGAPVFFIGVSTMVAAYKGLCVILHQVNGHGRTLEPWQDFDLDPNQRFDDDEATLASDGSSIATRMSRLKAFGSGNGFDGEEWIARWKRTNFVKKIFSKSVWVQEESVRLIQDKIVLQSQLWGVLLTIIATVFFCALPAGNYF